MEKERLVAHSLQLVMEMDQEGLSELRSLQRPPPDIEDLLMAVITILKGTSADVSWTKGAKRIMANLDRSGLCICDPMPLYIEIFVKSGP